MNPQENIDPLDALLQEENRHVPDAGFTKQVIASLPARRAARWPAIVLLGAAIIGSVATALVLPWEHLPFLPSLNAAALLSLNSALLIPWFTVSVAAVSVAWAVVAAVQWED